MPGGALAAPVALTVSPGTDIAAAGATLAGPAVQFGPPGTPFAASVTVTVPFDPSRLPAGATPADLVVLRRDDAAGQIIDLVPTAIQASPALVSALTTGFSTFQAAVRATPAVLSASPVAIDFGTVPVGGSTDRAVAIENVGGGVLSGAGTAGAPFSLPGVASYALSAGQSRLVVVRFTPAVAGAVSGTASFTGGGGAVIALSGTGAPTAQPALAASISYLDFGAVPFGTSVDRTFTVANSGGGVLSGAASVAAPFSVIGGTPYALGAGQAQTVTVRFEPASVGTFTATIACTGAGGAAIPAFGECTAAAPGAGGVLPAVLSFGAAPVGGTLEGRLTISSTGTNPLIGAVAVTAPFSVVGSATYALASGQTQVVTLRVTPAAPGAVSGVATLSGGVVPPTVSLTAFAGELFRAGGTFAVAAPRDLAVADLDANGRLDVAVGHGAAPPFLLAGDGAGGLSILANPPATPDQDRLLAIDIDRDGQVDLVCADRGAGVLALLWGDTPAAFTVTSMIDLAVIGAGGGSADAVAAGDIDRDGLTDLVVARATSGLVSLLRGTGSRAFAALSPIAVTAPADLALADLDGDGVLDLAVSAGAAGGVALLSGDGTGAFTPLAGLGGFASATRIAAVNLRHATPLDLVVLDGTAEEVTTWRNDGAGRFTQLAAAPAGPAPGAFVARDLDGDGEVDLAIACAGAAAPTVLKNLGDGAAFLALGSAAAGAGATAIAAGDLDRDGAPDLVVAREIGPGSGELAVLFGQVPVAHHSGFEIGGRTLATDNESVIFVIDISGSMGFDEQPYVDYLGVPRTGTRLARVQSLVAGAILALPSNFRLNVYAFDCDVRRWQAASAVADAVGKQSAIAWVTNLAPDGATGTGPAVASALTNERANLAIVLLSDGAPNCGANGMSGHRFVIRNANAQHARIHAVGINAYGVYEAFLRGVTTDSNGEYIPIR